MTTPRPRGILETIPPEISQKILSVAATAPGITASFPNAGDNDDDGAAPMALALLGLGNSNNGGSGDDGGDDDDAPTRDTGS